VSEDKTLAVWGTEGGIVGGAVEAAERRWSEAQLAPAEAHIAEMLIGSTSFLAVIPCPYFFLY
jgi:hypothetical protein